MSVFVHHIPHIPYAIVEPRLLIPVRRVSDNPMNTVSESARFEAEELLTSLL